MPENKGGLGHDKSVGIAGIGFGGLFPSYNGVWGKDSRLGLSEMTRKEKFLRLCTIVRLL
jgi:hypothetical protein